MRHSANRGTSVGFGAKRLSLEGLEHRTLLAVVPLITEATVAKAFVPTSQAQFDDLGLDWLSGGNAFDDSTWQSTPAGGPNGVGFDAASGSTKYDSYIGLDVQPQMLGVIATAFVRIPFNITDTSNFDAMRLKMRFDDGFTAYLNGVQIARLNAPVGYPNFVASATGSRDATSAFVVFDVSSRIDLLTTGTNVLAVRGFNQTTAQFDFLLQANLEATVSDTPPTTNDDAATTTQAVATTIDVLANDTAGDAPINRGSVQIVHDPDNGIATVNATTGAITYTPALSFRGQDSFTYRVRDIASITTPGGYTEDLTVVTTNAAHNVFVPTDGTLGTSWTGGTQPFDDSSWTTGSGGLGYDLVPSEPAFEPFIGDNVQGRMIGISPSVYVRIPFTIDDAELVSSLRLRVRYEDGFIAYLNGVPIATGNAPSTADWNSTSLTARNEAEAVVPAEFEIPIAGINLREGFGANILAIHGLNASLNSSDFLLQPELIAAIRTSGRWSNEATVTINVGGEGPVAIDDTAATSNNTPITIPVLANDQVAAPPNSFPLRPESVTIVSPPAHGTATVNPGTGEVTYQANPGFSGQDSFDYTVRDSAPVGGEAGSIAVLPRESVWKYLDTGIDHGTAWRESAFNDASWASGKAELGYADNPMTTVSYGPDANNKYPTTYFRTAFNLADPSAVQQLNVLASYDDGAVIYINGVEVARSTNLPAGAVTYNTLASPDHEGGTFETLRTLTGAQLAMLRTGTNVVAVEIHQNSFNSSDLTMDVELTALINAPTGRVSNAATVTVSVASTGEPPIANADDAFTLAGQAVEIDVLANDVPGGAPLDVGSVTIVSPPTHGAATVAANGRITYTPVAAFLGEESFSYTIRDTDGRLSNTAAISVTVASSVVTLGDDEYFVDEDDVLIVPVQYGVLANDTSTSGAVVSATVVEGPMFGSLALAANGSFQYTPNANFTGLDTFRYRGTDSNGTSAVAEVSLNVSSSPDAPFAFGDVYWTTLNAPLVVTAAPASRQMLVAKDSTWRYLDTGVVPSSSWRSANYEDSAWPSGPAQLGYGDGDEATVVSFGDDFNNRRITTYFRHEFDVADPSLVHAIELGLLRDDGAAVFLNGTRIALSNLPETNLTNNTLASSAAAGADETTYFTFDVSRSLLVPGRNVLAVEVHQSSVTSNDMSFDLFLRGDVAGPVSGGVLSNDIDPDGDFLTARVVTPPANGTLAMTADGGFMYTPNPGFEGSDTFTYKASDGMRESNVATVIVNVTPIGLLPGDLNDDGIVNAADLAVVVRGLGMTEGADKLKGDANGDGCVDLRDVLEVQRAMGAQRPAGAAAGAIVASARRATDAAANDAVLARATRTSLTASRRDRVVIGHTSGATLLGSANLASGRVDRRFDQWTSDIELATGRNLRVVRRR